MAVTLLLATSPLAGCRDVIEPYDSTDRVGDPRVPLQLTFSAGDDRSPAWSTGSDTVYYSSNQSEYVPRSIGVLMAVPRAGGLSTPLLDSQPGRAIPGRLMDPSRAPGAAAIAFVNLWDYHEPQPCGIPDFFVCEIDENPERLPSPHLIEAWLDVADSARALDWRNLISLGFSGGMIKIEPIGSIRQYLSRYLPHQQRWLARGELPFKPSWSPDGTRVATADDAGIRIVDVTTGAATTLVTGDVANPAWSPDGEWMAFDRVERLDSIVDFCIYQEFDPRFPDSLFPLCYEKRIYFPTTDPVVELVRLDGSASTTLGPGADPAWHPNGRWLFYAVEEGILRHDLETGAQLLVPLANDAIEPEVSPDGAWLAFTRDHEETGRDVWVVGIE